MPARLATSLLVGALVFAGCPYPAGAAQPAERTGTVEADVRRTRSAEGVAHSVTSDVPGEDAAERSTSSGRTRARRRTPALHYASVPFVEVLPDGSRCIRTVRRAYPSALHAAIAEDAENLLWRLAAASFPACPARAAEPPRAPAAQAAEFWRVVGEDLLPKPSPRIAPGYMLAGKLAYLEAGTVPTAAFEHPTPAGVLRIEARAEHWVDWDDGSSLSGPFDHPGGPWPHGTITHHWTDVGHYDVRVIQRWTGRWVLGTESGELAGLETEEVIEDFPVEQVQAVINR